MVASTPWIATLADVCNEENQSVATIRATFSDGQMAIESQILGVAQAECESALEFVCAGEIYLLPNGMIRIIEPGRTESADLAQVIERESQGRLRLRKDPSGIEEGLAMKQRVWAQEEHSVPFSEFVKRLKETSRRR
jgi:hypothetical protein